MLIASSYASRCFPRKRSGSQRPPLTGYISGPGPALVNLLCIHHTDTSASAAADSVCVLPISLRFALALWLTQTSGCFHLYSILVLVRYNNLWFASSIPFGCVCPHVGLVREPCDRPRCGVLIIGQRVLDAHDEDCELDAVEMRARAELVVCWERGRVPVWRLDVKQNSLPLSIELHEDESKRSTFAPSCAPVSALQTLSRMAR